MSTSERTGASPGKSGWTPVQVFVLATVFLLGGISIGYLVRSPGNPEPAPGVASAPPQGSGSSGGMAAGQQQTLEQQAAPWLQQLQRDPNNPDLLANLGNLYYDAQQYQAAIDYYSRSLQLRPGDVAVRTDMGTAYWYQGNADRALAEFRTVLAAAPTKPDTLFNLGIVQWQGKADAAAAVAAWQKLLDTNPAYEHRDKVKALIQEAQTQRKPAQSPN